MYEVRHFLTDYGVAPFEDFLRKVRDPIAKNHIARRVNRIESGNFGDHKYCREGVWEMRIDVGAGYRVYYAIDRGRVVLLLGGGDKGNQRNDIDQAVRLWRDH